MRVREATEGDFWRFYRQDPPARWFGEVAEREDGLLVGFGAVFWDAEGRAWASFERRARVPTVTVHRAVRRVLAGLRARGVDEVSTICNENIPGARLWLERLGFAPGDPVQDRVVWTWRP